MGWGDFFGAIGNLLPGRAEALKNQIDKVEKEMDRLYAKKSWTDSDAGRYVALATKLHSLEQKVRNRAS